MNKKCGIYKITSPSGRIYIGQSTNVEARILYYKRLYCKPQPLLYASIKKYGWGAHKFEIIHRCEPSELNGLEKYYVELYNCFNTNHGLNLKGGGGGSGKLSDAAKQKMILKNKGRQRTSAELAVLEKMRLSNIGRPRPDAVRKKIGAGNKISLKGRKRSEAEKNKISAGRYAISKLLPKQIFKIREMLRAGEKMRVMVKTFGVAKSTIYSIRDGKTWQHLPATFEEYQTQNKKT
jgi:group I intron endonuclease